MDTASFSALEFFLIDIQIIYIAINFLTINNNFMMEVSPNRSSKWLLLPISHHPVVLDVQFCLSNAKGFNKLWDIFFFHFFVHSFSIIMKECFNARLSLE